MARVTTGVAAGPSRGRRRALSSGCGCSSSGAGSMGSSGSWAGGTRGLTVGATGGINGAGGQGWSGAGAVTAADRTWESDVTCRFRLRWDGGRERTATRFRHSDTDCAVPTVSDGRAQHHSESSRGRAQPRSAFVRTTQSPHAPQYIESLPCT